MSFTARCTINYKYLKNMYVSVWSFRKYVENEMRTVSDCSVLVIPHEKVYSISKGGFSQSASV